MIRLADTYSKKLLVVAPDAADAYLGLGTANYFIGSQPGIKKIFLGFAGIHGDKKAGVAPYQAGTSLQFRVANRRPKRPVRSRFRSSIMPVPGELGIRQGQVTPSQKRVL
jgi:hypothetical protein